MVGRASVRLNHLHGETNWSPGDVVKHVGFTLAAMRRLLQINAQQRETTAHWPLQGRQLELDGCTSV